MGLFERMAVRVRSEDVSDIIRMRKKAGHEAVKQVLLSLRVSMTN